LRRVLERFSIKQFLGFGFFSICFEQSHAENVLLGVRDVPDQRPNSSVFHGNSGKHLVR